MRPRTRLLAAAIAVVAWDAPAPLEAALHVEVHGGWSRHAMGDANDSLRSLNADIGTDLGPIRSGPSWGVGLSQWAGQNVLMRLEFEKLSAATEDSAVRVNLGAHVYSVSATWFVPASRRIHYGLGVGFGHYRSWGELAGLETSGNDFGASVAAEAIMPVGGEWSLHGALGYRRARIRNVKLGGSASDIDPDYSGAFLRIGIAAGGRRPQQAEGP